MSDVSIEHDHPAAVPGNVIPSLLDAVGARLKRYAVLSGVLLLVSVAIGVFWLTSGIDAAWFAVQRLELPVTIRTLVLGVMAVGGSWVLFEHVLRPLLRRTQDRELATLLERRFPEFQDGLLTTIEAEQGYPDSGDLVAPMLRRTAERTRRVAYGVSADDVFETASVKKLAYIAGLLLVTVMISALVRPGSLQRWWSAFVVRADAYHVRTTAVEASVIAQPGDRRVSFHDVDGQETYLHPRGADLEVEFVIPEGTSQAGIPWVVPERVRVDVYRADGSLSRAYVSPTTGRTFRFILTRLQESVEIDILAGDYRNAQPWRVECVTPPAVDSVTLDCRYPEYTGWNESELTSLAVLGSEVSLPLGTEFQLTVQSNKALQRATITSDFFELSGDSTSTALQAADGYLGQLATSMPLVSADGMTLTASFRLVAISADAEVPSGATDDDSGSIEVGATLPLPSNTALRFVLHDQDDVVSVLPESLRVRGIPDKPPVVAIRSVGVSNAVTRNAKIPFSGLIRDDYAVVSAHYQFLVDDRSVWSQRPLENRFVPGAAYDLESGSGPGSEYFSVQREELTEGQTLAISVLAIDNCELPEPRETRAEPMVFRIVSNEELLSLLYTRELSLRRRFEETIERLEEIREDLVFHGDVASRIKNADGSTRSGQDRIAVTTCATRCSNGLRKQSNELESITESFEAIAQELVNNVILPRLLTQEMRGNVIAPLRDVVVSEVRDADRSLSTFRVTAAAGQADPREIAVAASDVSKVVTKLRVILESVRDMADRHEMLSELKDITEQHLRIMEETKREQIRRLGLP